MRSKFQHHDASFAMLHASSAVGNTEWEGTNPKSAFQYMYGLLNLPKYKKKLGLNGIEHKNVNAALVGLIELQALFDSFFSDGEMKIDHPKLLAKIRSITKELSGVCYLPSGWISDECGHFLGVKMRQISGTTYACSAINRGAGAGYHRTLQDAKTRYKKDFQFAEYQIDLSSELGRYFLEAIVTMKVETKLFNSDSFFRKSKDNEGERHNLYSNSYKSQLAPYDADDLYSLFALCGEQSSYSSSGIQRAASLQRSGTCTITNTKSIIHDCILMTSPHFTEAKMTKFTFVLKLASLLEAYDALLQNLCHQDIFEWALHEASVRFAKDAPKDLTESEEREYRNYFRVLRQGYQDIKSKQIETACRAKPLPPLRCAFKQMQPTGDASRQIEYGKSTGAATEVSFNIIQPESDQVFDYMVRAIKYFTSSSNSSVIPKSVLQHQYITFMRSLPPTSGESQDTFWDEVPEELIVNILQYFCELQNLMQAKEEQPSLYNFETALIAYDIAAQLTPRIEDLRLGDQYTFGLSDVFTDKNTYLDPITYQTVKQISTNFLKRQAKKSIIFSNYVDGKESKSNDKTADYLQGEWLTVPVVTKLLLKLKEEQFIKESVKAEHLSFEYKTNVLLTQSAPTDGGLAAFDVAPIVGHPFVHVIQLSATVHSMGLLIKTYVPLQHGKLDNSYHFQTSLRLCFNADTTQLRNKLLSEQLDLENQSSACAEIVKRLPNLLDPNQQPGDFVDVLENTLSHPVDDWRAQYKHVDETDTLPYALKPSGSFQPTSPAWSLGETDLVLQKMESLDETMRRIEATGTMKVNQLLAWAQQNVNTLIMPEVRQSILNTLFSYGSLDHALSQHPVETIELINQFLHNAFRYCTTRLKNRQDHEQDSALVFLGYIQYHLVNYARLSAKLYGFQLDKLQPINFSEILKDSISLLSCAKGFLFSYSLRDKIDQQDYASLLTAKFICATNSTSDFTSSDIYELDAWGQLWQDVDNYLKNLSSVELNQVMAVVANHALQMKSDRKWKYKDGQLLCKSIKLSFEIKSGILSRNSARIIDFTKIAMSWQVFKKLKLDIKIIKLFEDKDSASWSKNINVLKTADQQWEFTYSVDSQRLREVKRRVTIDNVTHLMKLQDELQWVDQDNASAYFVETDEHAYFYHPDTGRQRVLLQADGCWQRDGAVILDLEHGVSDLEVEWRDFFQGKVELSTVTIVTKDLGNKELQVESLSLKSLDLSFVRKDNKMISNEYPGYFLSEKTHIPELSNVNTLIILCNDKNDCKYIMPAYELKKSAKPNGNAVFTRKKIFSEEYTHVAKIADDQQGYFEYAYDRNNNFIGCSVEAELYLAVIYRALGDYRRAIQSINRCYDFRSYTEAHGHIAAMIIDRPDQSPLGAALDCHFACLIFHQQRKWVSTSLNQKAWVPFGSNTNSDFAKHVRDRYDKYLCSISSKRQDVFIVPDYLRLTLENQKDLKQAVGMQPGGVKMIQDDNFTENFFVRESLENLKRWLDNNKKITGIDLFKKQEKTMPFSLRAYCDQDETLTVPRDVYFSMLGSSLEKFLRYYVNLYEDALSSDPAIQKATRAKIFYLKHGDKAKSCNEVYDTLYLVLQFPEAFKKNDQNFVTTLECLNHVAEIISKMLDQHEVIKLDTVALIINPEEKLEYKAPEPPVFPDFVAAKLNLDKYLQAPRQYFPYQDVAEAFVIKTSVLPKDAVPLLQSPENASLIEKKLVDRLNDGHEQNTKRETIRYGFKNDSLVLLQGAIRKSITEDESLFQEQSQKIVLATNAASNGSRKDYLQVLQHGHQIPVLSPDDIIFDCLLTQDYTRLQRANPLLDQGGIDKITQLICDYAVTKTRIDLGYHILSLIGGKKSISDLSSYQQQKLAQAIEKKRAYDIRQYPEFLVYEYATQRVLRENQVDALIKLIRYAEQPDVSAENPKHALLQFAAGGGKTSVMIPILAQRFARKGLLPIIFNTNELYDIGIQEIPESLKNSFRQHIEVIEKDLNHQWTVAEFTLLAADIKAWHLAGKCILLKPTTWHAINACKRMAYNQKDSDLRAAASTVLDYLKQHAIKLEDEGHIISDPLRKSIKTFGNILQIPLAQQKLIVAFYDYLLNKKDDAEAISKLAGIINRSKKHLSDHEIATLKTQLIDKTILFSQFSALDKFKLKSYLAQEGNNRPEFLVDLRENNSELAGLVVLARAFIQTLLPHILTLQYKKDFGHSINPGDLTAAPKRNATDVSSHFSDQILVLALSIQFYHMSGVPEQHISIMIEQFHRRHESERRWNHVHETTAEIELNNLLPDDYPLIDLDALTCDQQSRICSDDSVRFHQKIINLFLFDSVFRQIGAPKYRVESTAADFQAGFLRSIIFSATPTLAECYPEYLDKDQFHDLPSFEAKVVATLLQPKNQSHCILKMTDQPKDMFDQIKREYPEIFIELHALIDAGALYTDLQPTAVVRAILSTFDEGHPITTAVCFNQKNLTLQSKQKRLDNIKVIGTDVLRTLEQQGINPNQFLLFLFLDLSRTTGTDLVRPDKDRAALTIGKGQILTNTIQAAMRERKLLEDDAQTLTWIIFKSLYQKINNSTDFDLEKVIYWMIKNEAIVLQKKVINRAYQGIDQILRAVVEEKYSESEKKLSQLIQLNSVDPYLMYEVESELKDPNVVLDGYIDSMCEFFEINKDQDLSPIMKKRLRSIVSETQALIEKLRQPYGAVINEQQNQEQQSIQETEQEQEMEQEQRLLSLDALGYNFKFSAEHYTLAIDGLVKLFDGKSHDYQPLRLPGCHDIKIPTLLINVEHFQPVSTMMTDSTEITWLKPIQGILIQLSKERQLKVVACTAAGIQYFEHQIMQLADNCDIGFAIFGIDGKMLCCNNSITEHDRSWFSSSGEIDKLSSFVTFLNGRVDNPGALAKVIKQYSWSKNDYQQLTHTIKSVLITRQPINLTLSPLLSDLFWPQLAKQDSSKSSRKRVTGQAHSKILTFPVLPSGKLPERRAQSAAFNRPYSYLPQPLFERQLITDNVSEACLKEIGKIKAANNMYLYNLPSELKKFNSSTDKLALIFAYSKKASYFDIRSVINYLGDKKDKMALVFQHRDLIPNSYALVEILEKIPGVQIAMMRPELIATVYDLERIIAQFKATADILMLLTFYRRHISSVHNLMLLVPSLPTSEVKREVAVKFSHLIRSYQNASEFFDYFTDSENNISDDDCIAVIKCLEKHIYFIHEFECTIKKISDEKIRLKVVIDLIDHIKTQNEFDLISKCFNDEVSKKELNEAFLIFQASREKNQRKQNEEEKKKITYAKVHKKYVKRLNKLKGSLNPVTRENAIAVEKSYELLMDAINQHSVTKNKDDILKLVEDFEQAAAKIDDSVLWRLTKIILVFIVCALIGAMASTLFGLYAAGYTTSALIVHNLTLNAVISAAMTPTTALAAAASGVTGAGIYAFFSQTNTRQTCSTVRAQTEDKFALSQ